MLDLSQQRLLRPPTAMMRWFPTVQDKRILTTSGQAASSAAQAGG